MNWIEQRKMITSRKILCMRARKITLILNTAKQVNDITVESLQLQHAKSSQRISTEQSRKKTSTKYHAFCFHLTVNVNFICADKRQNREHMRVKEKARFHFWMAGAQRYKKKRNRNRAERK